MEYHDLKEYDWYVGYMSRQRAESLLRQEDKDGCFIVRLSETYKAHKLSLYVKSHNPYFQHYIIKRNELGHFFIYEEHCSCLSIPDLVSYHRHTSGGLPSRLKATPFDHDEWKIPHGELKVEGTIGSGNFSEVRRGKWMHSIDVAIKTMKPGVMSEIEFIAEAKVMKKLQHANVVPLYGICRENGSIHIVTQYMARGSLLDHLRLCNLSVDTDFGLLLDICKQVCEGMAYLEDQHCIHRDLAARNCLVDDRNVVKVADFGLARRVLVDDKIYYRPSNGTTFAVRWAPPEVITKLQFSSKSDVWAFGVLMWEVFTCGEVPYGQLKRLEDVETFVCRGSTLEIPKTRSEQLSKVMRKCWDYSPEGRPSFGELKAWLQRIPQGPRDDTCDDPMCTCTPRKQL